MDRKNTQQSRLTAGMIAACHRHGYAGASVSRVIASAGVSRPTFYDYFRNREECFLATHREVGRLLLQEIRLAVACEAPERAIQAAIRRMVGLSESFPDRANLLVNEALAAGHRALDQHDRLIDDIAAIVEEGRREVGVRTPTPDLPLQAVLSAGRWLLAPALRRGEVHLTTLADDLDRWVEHYARPSSEHRWHTLEVGPRLEPSPHVSPLSLEPPPPIPPGRPRGSASDIARNQRERIMYATAGMAALKGYNETTIADITKSARVDRRVFYRHYRDKQQAFLAVHELAIQQIMALAASAFFSEREWPERVWEAIRATTQFEASHPIITHIGHVESHAVGAPAIQRIDDTRAAFTIFLQEGSQYASEPPTRTAMEAIAGAIFEIGYRQARQGHSERISRLAPNATYLALAPFMGPVAACDFVDAKRREAMTQTLDRPDGGLPIRL
jgi:AcrR family transcriptional regulator